MTTLLFFDDWNLHARRSVSRHVGDAELVREGTFEDPNTDTSWGYPSVIRDPKSGQWLCLYQGQYGLDRHLALVAESGDGIHWSAPDVSSRGDQFERVAPNQVLPRDRFWEWSGPYADPTAVGTDEWLKGLVVYKDDATANLLRPTLVTSGDGLHWKQHQDVVWAEPVADPISFVFWNRYRKSHVFVSRPRHNDRRIGIYETRDWSSFTQVELALQADALDTTCCEIYGMPVFEYEDIFVGLLWLYHTDSGVDANNKYRLGKIDCQLAYSLNGWHFQRTIREPLISNSRPGEFGAGCVYPYSLVVLDDEIRVYSSASIGEHAQVRGRPEDRQGALLLHRLRRDGFVYLAPDGGVGEISTRLLRWDGGSPKINIDVPLGEVRAQFTDISGTPIAGFTFEECSPFCGNDVEWQPRWLDNRQAGELAGRIVRLQLRWFGGRLYAIRGAFAVAMAHEAARFADRGDTIVTRSGL